MAVRRSLFSATSGIRRIFRQQLLLSSPKCFDTTPLKNSNDSLPSCSMITANTRGSHCSAEFEVFRRLFSTEQASESASSCWSCGSPSPFLSCNSCGSVQPVDPSVDYFQIFGIEKGFEVKLDYLERKYKEWQKKLHPDLVHTKSEKEKAFAAEQSARVIEAYRTLQKPLSRAVYLLRLEGIHADEEQTVDDPELLVEVMEIRESVEEAADSGALKQVKNQVEKKIDRWFKHCQVEFMRRKFDNAVASIQRLTYYQRALEEIGKRI